MMTPQDSLPVEREHKAPKTWKVYLTKKFFAFFHQKAARLSLVFLVIISGFIGISAKKLKVPSYLVTGGILGACACVSNR
jgi:hypothetical protein